MKRTISGVGGPAAWRPWPAPRAEILEQILVKVNGEIITKTELETAPDGGASRQQEPEPAVRRRRRSCARRSPRSRRELIVDAVDELLIVQRGRELGYTMSRRAVQRASSTTSRRTTRSRPTQQFQAALKQEGMTLADLRQAAREADDRSSACSRREVMSKIAGHRRRAEDVLRQPQERVHHDAAAHAARDPGGRARPATAASTSGARTRRGRRPRRSASALLAGEPFEKLAADLSDSPSKANGGLIGPLDRATSSRPSCRRSSRA